KGAGRSRASELQIFLNAPLRPAKKPATVDSSVDARRTSSWTASSARKSAKGFSCSVFDASSSDWLFVNRSDLRIRDMRSAPPPQRTSKRGPARGVGGGGQ